MQRLNRILVLGFSWTSCLFPMISQANDICANPNDISFLVNRPANAVSPCTVPKGHFLPESGYQRHNWSTGSYANIFPFTQLRLGLPKDTEIYTYLPTYTGNKAYPYSGITTVSIGGKHTFWEQGPFIFTVDGMLILPGGSAQYGSQSIGEHLNGVFSYTIDSRWNFLFMLSIYNQGQPAIDNNLRYSGIGPDFVLSYLFTPKMTVYAEVFGQSKVSPILGSGFNADAGFIFSIKKNMTLDIEVGTRLSGQIGSLSTYVGAGGAIQL